MSQRSRGRPEKRIGTAGVGERPRKLRRVSDRIGPGAGSSGGLPVVGMVGAGRLARMTAQAAISLGIEFRVLAEDPMDSAAQVCAGTVIGDYRSADDLLGFAARCDVVTFDDEHVPVEHLEQLEQIVAVRPGASALRFALDNIAMRDRLSSFGLLAELGVRWPRNDEERVRIASQFSVLVARSPKGQGASYPVVRTEWRDGVCVEVMAPASGLDPGTARNAQRLGLALASEFGVTGLLALDVSRVGGELIVSDLAMRPHQCGNWTIDGAVTSQFEQYLRAVLDLPLGATAGTAPAAVTVTVLGAEGGDDAEVYSRLVHVMAADPGARVHLHGGQAPSGQPGRRRRSGCEIGHVTVTGADVSQLRDRAWRAANYLSRGTEEPADPDA
jgi:5-(carboxyamino)imidazole ribonucleotide synthase